MKAASPRPTGRGVRAAAEAARPGGKLVRSAGKTVRPAAEAATSGGNAARILAAIRAIPRGEVAGYGVVAQRAGLPGRARLTARVLRENDDPDLPWYRVLRSDGRIAFPEGSRGFREQCRRLRAEGVKIEKGRVLRARPARSLDQEVWEPR